MRLLFIALFSLCAFIQVHSLTDIDIPNGAKAGNVCAGPDGLEWFVASNEIGYVDTKTFAVKEIAVPGTTTGLVGCSFSPGGVLYFSNQKTYMLISYNPATGVFTSTQIPWPNYGIAGLMWHTDGRLYILISGSNAIQRMNSDGTWAPVIWLSAGALYPHGPASCADGNLWFSLVYSNQLGYLSPKGDFVALSLDAVGANTYPFGVACNASDPATYAVLYMTSQVVRVPWNNLTRPQVFNAGAGNYPRGIAVSSTTVYVGLTNTNAIGMMPIGGGPIDPISIPDANASPNKVGIGPDGTAWCSLQTFTALCNAK